MKTTMIATAAIILLSASLSACSKNADQSANARSMDAMEKEGAAPAVEEAHGFGTIASLDQAARKVTISHDPIPEIGWDAMTMAFAVDEAIDVASLNEGDKVHFMLKPAGDGPYTVAMACRIEGDMEAHESMMKAMGDMKGDIMMSMEAQGGAVMPCNAI